MQKKLKIGLIGVGHLGKIHLKLLHELSDNFELIGFYDPSVAVQEWVNNHFSLTSYSSYQQLIHDCEVVDIVAPTSVHFEIAKYALENGTHCFIEKPATSELWQTEELVRLAEKYQNKIQIGFVERFNPAFKAVKDQIKSLRLVEFTRHAIYNPRGTDVSVVHDLMVHDIDLLLSLVDSPIKNIEASGFSTISKTEDFVSSRITFEDETIAVFSISRNALENIRTVSLHQTEHASFHLDLQSKTVKKLEYPHNTNYLPNIDYCEIPLKVSEIPVKNSNAIKEELHSFYLSIANNSSISTDIYAALKNAQLVELILEQIRTEIPVNV